MVAHFTQCDADYGRRVAEGLRQSASSNGNGQGSPIGVDDAKADAAVKSASEEGHPAKAY